MDIASLIDLENTAWELTEQVMILCDNVENKEPLQARQTFDLIKERIRAVEAYIDSIAPTETPTTEDGTDPDAVPQG